MKQLKLLMLFVLLLTICMPITFVEASTSKVKLDKQSVTLEVGKIKQLKILNTTHKVSWSSKNKKIAKVSSGGKVRAIAVGNTEIVAQVGSEKYSCKVKVSSIVPNTVNVEEKQTVTVTFDSQGGPSVSPIILQKGSTLDSLPKIERAGCNLNGWYLHIGTIKDGIYYTNIEYETSIDITKPIESDITLYAVWETGNYMEYEYSSNWGENISLNTIIKKADSILSEIITPNMTEFDKVKVVYDYIMIHTTYATGDREDWKGTVYTAAGPLITGEAVCAGYADAFWICMKMLDIDCKCIIASYKTHEWNIVKIDGNWYHVDATWDDDNKSYPIGELSHYIDFLQSDIAFKEGHLWDVETNCVSTKYDNYAEEVAAQRRAQQFYEDKGMTEEEYSALKEAEMALNFLDYYGITYEEFFAEYGIKYYDFESVYGEDFDYYIDKKGRNTTNPLELKIYIFLNGDS